jgi:hypothetical protein
LITKLRERNAPASILGAAIVLEPYQTRLDPPPGPPADAEGNFLPPPMAPRPTASSRLAIPHPPTTHRECDRMRGYIDEYGDPRGFASRSERRNLIHAPNSRLYLE